MNFFKIFKSKFKPKIVNLPYVQKDGTILEVPVKAGTEEIYQKLIRARELSEKSGMPIDGWLTVVKREWHSDSNGKEIAPVTGERGYYTDILHDYMVPNLLTTGGRDDFIDKCYIHNGQGTAAGNFIGLSNDAGGASAAHTALASEIVANGLSRAQATTRTHTAGMNDWSLQYTWTCMTAPQAAQLAGLFTQIGPPVAGVMSHENTFTPVSLQINDQLQLTWSGTLG